MSLTILIDLDNTLLFNDLEQNEKPFITKLIEYLPEWPPEKVISELLASRQQMVSKDTSSQTLEQVFRQSFSTGFGTEKDTLNDRINFFYREIYPEFRQFIRPNPEARILLEILFQRKYSVIIATNPLDPRTAILQRMDWADIPVERFPFSLITSRETFHFSKPNPAYLAETLAMLGWPDQPAVMIGDSLNLDIMPAGKLGLPAFWLNDSGPLPQGLHPLSAFGKLADILPWLEVIEKEAAEALFSTLTSISAILKSTPAAFEALTTGLSASQWQERPGENEWATNEIACHLRDVDREVNLPRFKMVSAGENPFLPGIVTDVWANERDYIHQDGYSALNSFVEVRTELLSLLASLDVNGWKMPARHAIFGPTQLLELASFIGTHDRTHIHQVYDTINRVRPAN